MFIVFAVASVYYFRANYVVFPIYIFFASLLVGGTTLSQYIEFFKLDKTKKKNEKISAV